MASHNNVPNGDAKVETKPKEEKEEFIGEHKQKKDADLMAQESEARQADQVNGLSPSVIDELREKWGWNELVEKKRPLIIVFLSYFWGPMPFMIWVAIIIELAKSIAVGEGWEDFGVLMALQFINATVGFIEENNAGNAIAALKQQLAPKCHVCRGGQWSSIPAKELVPGDLIELKIGDVVPADGILLEGDPVQVDQAALTGESLPVTIHPWGHVKMGSAIKQGEIKAVVTRTGANTFFGKAAGMIASVQSSGHLQSILFRITMILLVTSVVLCSIIFAILMTANEGSYPQSDASGGSQFVRSLSVVIVILVASIPVAIEVVVTSTLAVGSHRMAHHKVIVARLSAIEELAGMTILCSDKTGTLTLNQLSLREPTLISKTASKEEILFYSALASKRESSNQDAIDLCITSALSPAERERAKTFIEVKFVPFNPNDKRTEATVSTPEGTTIKVSKGAPQAVLKLVPNRAEIEPSLKASVQELADRGFRALGVAINRSPDSPTNSWEYLGILSLFDPPRPDTKSTIAAAIDNGIEVKMITGDQTAIAKETCRELGMGTNILNTEVLNDKNVPQELLDRIILEAHGFAEVMPEHKFQIVDRVRLSGHVTGMTGDGVNDAPALKRADIGIAVHGATDAARAAADIVLTEPGLSVIITAIFESRKIFQRMRNYIIYRIACTVQLLCFFFFASIAVYPDSAFMYNREYATNDPTTNSDPNFNPFCATCDPLLSPYAHSTSFTLPVIALVIITILNDGCMITISYDKVIPEKRPQKWHMGEVWIVALVLGFIACVSSLILLAYAMHANVLHQDNFFGYCFGSSGRHFIQWYELRTIIYFKISISDFLTLFSARTRTWFFERMLGKALTAAACFALTISTLLSLFWDVIVTVNDATMDGIRFSDGAAISVWVYCLLWWQVQDVGKVFTYFILEKFFKSEADKKIETFAKRHSAETAVPDGHDAADKKAAPKPHGEFLPAGVDLNAIAQAAAEETVRTRTRKQEAAEEAKRRQQLDNLKGIAGNGTAAPGDVTVSVAGKV